MGMVVRMTSERTPFQTEILHVLGTPNGRDYAPAGFVEVDDLTGQWWRKTTDVTLNTGWVVFGGSGVFPQLINFIYWEDSGPLPSGPPPDTTLVWTVKFRDGTPDYTWDPQRQGWF